MRDQKRDGYDAVQLGFLDKKREKAKTKEKAKERSKKARTESEKKHKRIYDERCASVFENDFQHTAFKQAVTSESGRRFIAVSQQ